MIIGVSGACRTDELTNLTTDDVQDKDDILIIKISNTKNYKQRTFIICNSDNENATDIVSTCKKYFRLRPKNMTSKRLFVKYVSGKCVAQNVGHHTIGAIPSKIATFLNLCNANEYTGHCFRRTSATLLADSGADITTIKRHGSWKSDCVAEGYIEESIQNKISIAVMNLTKLIIKVFLVLQQQLLLQQSPNNNFKSPIYRSRAFPFLIAPCNLLYLLYLIVYYKL